MVIRSLQLMFTVQNGLSGLKIITLGAISFSGILAGQATAAPFDCKELLGMKVPANVIGLRTRGGIVTRITNVAAGGKGSKSFGPYCKLEADILPIDQKAPSIKMELDLPAAWNGKAMMFGGGGFDGTIPDTTADVPAGTLDKPTPLGRGYAMFASDSGHQLSSNPDEPGAFALNDEARRNFSFEALKKVHDAALFYIKARYARKPDKAYMAGGSSGGREALAFAQRWPTDFDGLIVYYPASAAASLDLAFGRITRALAAPNGYLTPTKRQALFKAALETCDRLDGVEDGVISNQRACNAQFDPGVALVGHKPLRCPGGADTGEDCLSDPQIASMRVINSAISFPHRIANTESGYPGFNAWGADFGNSGAGLEHLVTFLGLGTKAPVAPIGTPTFAGGGVPYSAGFWDQWVKYFVTRDSKFDSLSFDPSNPGIYGRRVAILKKEQDLTATDLSVFQKHGGKILIVHGTADQLVSPRATESYVDGVRKKMGDERTRSFLRYYEVPGYAHVVSTVFNASWDSLTALEKWVEIGQPPLNPVAADISGVPGRTRPLCEYPTWPRYAGKGDVNSAASFTCSTH